MALHDLVNLSCDDLDTNTTNKLNNKKQQQQKRCQRLLPWLVACVHPVPSGGHDGFNVYLIAYRTSTCDNSYSNKGVFPLVLRLRWFIFRYRFMQKERSLRIDFVYFVWQTSPRGCYAGCYAVLLEHVERGATEAASLSQCTDTTAGKHSGRWHSAWFSLCLVFLQDAFRTLTVPRTMIAKDEPRGFSFFSLVGFRIN